jgi:hypothetical protein
VWACDANDVVAAGNAGTILRFDGSSWSPMTSGTTNALRGLWGSSATRVFAVGDNGTALAWNGSSWSPAGLPAGPADLLDVWGAPGGEVIVAGQGVYRHDGSSWSEITEATYQTLYGVHGLSAGDFFVAGANGIILHHP